MTHDLFEALTLADRIAVMREGRIEQVDTPARLVNEPKTDFVHNLFGRPAAQLEAFQDLLNG